jgi:hypothetical protein
MTISLAAPVMTAAGAALPPTIALIRHRFSAGSAKSSLGLGLLRALGPTQVR